MKPKLSVVIPTKNRYQYLMVFLKSFLKFSNSEIELVIQDNSDTQDNLLFQLIEQSNDKRIIYNHIATWLSVVDNCDIAIDQANGKYILMLGDDDGILFDLAMIVVERAIKYDYDAVIFNKADYYWPDTRHAVWGDTLSGNVFFRKYSGKDKYINVSSELRKVLRQGAAWSIGNLPNVYHGLVKKELLHSLKVKTGSFFPGPSPDMANAVGLSLIASRVVLIDAPVVISGHSKRSGGGMGGEKKHQGKIEEQIHLPKNTLNYWSENIPKFWSGPTIYAESARQALEKSNSTLKINYTYLLAFCFVFETRFWHLIFKAVPRSPYKLVMLVYYSFSIFLYRAVNYLRNYVFFKSKKGSFSFLAENIEEAQNQLKKIVKNFE